MQRPFLKMSNEELQIFFRAVACPEMYKDLKVYAAAISNCLIEIGFDESWVKGYAIPFFFKMYPLG